MATGRFITVEGIEGAGKSTCLSEVTRAVRARGLDMRKTREPGGTPLGEDLRQLLLGHRHDGMSDDAELLLMFAARAEHLRSVIEPSLANGTWVLCDRFTDATYAYQGYGRGLSLTRIQTLEQWVQGDRRPDLTLLLDVPVEIGLARAGRRSAPDRFERQATEFFKRVRDGYLELALTAPRRFRVVDAARPLNEVTEEIGRVMDAYLDLALIDRQPGQS